MKKALITIAFASLTYSSVLHAFGGGGSSNSTTYSCSYQGLKDGDVFFGSSSVVASSQGEAVSIAKGQCSDAGAVRCSATCS